MSRSPNADMRSPTDEACRFEDEYRPMTPEEDEANWQAFLARQQARRCLNDTFKREAAA